MYSNKHIAIYLLALTISLQKRAFGKSYKDNPLEIILVKRTGSANSTSSNYEYPPEAAFGNGPSFWQSDVLHNLPQSIWWQFRDSIIVGGYSFGSRNDGKYVIADGPFKFIFWGSNGQKCDDERKWVILDDDNINYQLNKMQNINNKKPYFCYGFKVLEVPGRKSRYQQWVTMSGIHFYHPDSRDSRSSSDTSSADVSQDLSNNGSSECSSTFRCNFYKGRCMPRGSTCQYTIVKGACEHSCICCSQNTQISGSKMIENSKSSRSSSTSRSSNENFLVKTATRTGSSDCSPTSRCRVARGTCVALTEADDCQGTVHQEDCDDDCVCCYPGNNHLTHIDDLELEDIWNHLLNQFLHPFEDRFFPRGKHYVYILDTETPPDSPDTMPIIVPTIDDIETMLADVGHTHRGGENLTSIFSTETRDAISKLEDLYSRTGFAKDILTLAVNVRDHINEYVHLAALRQVLLFEEDMIGFILPPLFESFPEWFIKHPPEDDGECDGCYVDIDDTSKRHTLNSTEGCTFQKPSTYDLVGDEWKVSYWREDRDLNAFHGDWHFYNSRRRGGPKWDDPSYRHGELFYYFYSQILARYDHERLSNNLPRVRPLSHWDDGDHIRDNFIADLIHPTLDRCASQSAENLRWLRRYRKNIEEDIDLRYLIDSVCHHIKIGDDAGIRLLGCVLEHDFHGCGNTFTEQYSDISNRGHKILSKLGCEYEKNSVAVGGVLGVPWAAPRDPLFYRWHEFIDDLFSRHKNTLEQYTEEQLALPQVEINDVSIQSEDCDHKNELQTFNSYRKIYYSHMKGESGCVYQPHINSHPYNYSIKINNNGEENVNVHLRIYLAPVLDIKNFTMSFEEQRTLWALMDNFRINLRGKTSRKIIRSSCDSTVTVTPPLSSDHIKNIFRKNFDTSKEEQEGYKYREPRDFPKRQPIRRMCGLPNHLLLPKGWPEGMPFQFFFYASHYPLNKQLPIECEDLESSDLCGTDYLHCSSYNDEPMGFPFDRPLKKIGCNYIDFTKDLVVLLPNVKVHDVKIFYSDIVHNDVKCVE